MKLTDVHPVWIGDAGEGIIDKSGHFVCRREGIGIKFDDGIMFEPFPVIHSTRAPAVGYRVKAGRVVIFYVPDVVRIHERSTALRGIKVYVGDGAAITRSMVRREKKTGRGHASIKTQLQWCQEEKVPRIIVTHCGSDIVAGRKSEVASKLGALVRRGDVHLDVAIDGMEVILR